MPCSPLNDPLISAIFAFPDLYMILYWPCALPSGDFFLHRTQSDCFHTSPGTPRKSRNTLHTDSSGQPETKSTAPPRCAVSPWFGCPQIGGARVHPWISPGHIPSLFQKVYGCVWLTVWWEQNSEVIKWTKKIVLAGTNKIILFKSFKLFPEVNWYFIDSIIWVQQAYHWGFLSF